MLPIVPPSVEVSPTSTITSTVDGPCETPGFRPTDVTRVWKGEGVGTLSSRGVGRRISLGQWRGLRGRETTRATGTRQKVAFGIRDTEETRDRDKDRSVGCPREPRRLPRVGSR